jgi:hypothetical protein
MNNFIKFRAWDKLQKLMVHTHDRWSPKNTPAYYSVMVCNLGIIYTQRATDCSHITVTDSQGKTQEFYSNWDTTDIYDKEIELMPSTGQLDVNGVEIFVGDIIECDYIKRSSGQIIKKIIEIDHICFGCFGKGDIANFNVIGNKYENPDIC